MPRALDHQKGAFTLLRGCPHQAVGSRESAARKSRSVVWILIGFTNAIERGV